MNFLFPFINDKRQKISSLYHNRLLLSLLLLTRYFSCLLRRSSSDVVTNVLDCDKVISEFELRSLSYVHFPTNIQEIFFQSPYPPIYVLNSTSSLFYKNGFDIYLFTKDELPLNKEIKLYAKNPTWFCFILWHINYCGSLMPNPFLYI